MKKQFLGLCLIILVSIVAHAQNLPELNSEKIIKKGVELHDQEKYQEAIAEFSKVNSNDSNYVEACLELANSYIASKQDSLAVAICDRGMVLPSFYTPNLMLYKANALDNLKNHEAATKLYEEGMAKYPLNNSFYYEYGVLKLRQEKFKEAQDLFIKSIGINPYHAASHFQMALLAVRQGKLLPAMLAVQFYLIVDNSSNRAKGLVTDLESMSKNEYEMKDPITIEGLTELDDFSELEALVKSKIALSNKYKSKIALNFNLTKQLQLVLEKIKTEKSDKGFYMQFYAPIFEAINKNNYFEEYAYTSLSGVGNSDVDAWTKKHKDDVQKFATWLIKYLGETICMHDVVLNGKPVRARYWYSNNKISAVGNEDANGKDVGYWNYYYSNGVLRSEGGYNSQSQRIGLWKYYNQSGLLKDIENYVDGVVEGPVEIYFSNGNVKTKKNFAKNQLDGPQSEYYPTGKVQNTYEFKAGKQLGKESSYYVNGALKYSIQLVNEKYDGTLTQFYNNGHVMEKSTFANGSRIGKSQNFYNYPENTLKSELMYENGIAVKEYKSFYRNGKPEEIGNLNKKGDRDGSWKIFYEDGTIKEERSYSNGKWDGISKYYDELGKITEELNYRNDILVEYKAYDASGKVINQNKKDGKNTYEVNLYHPNGNKKREGKVVGGLTEGEWKSYNVNGFVTNVDHYVKGNNDGKVLVYHNNGKIKTETDYKDGETNGYYRNYFPNGKLKQEGAYIQDKEMGVWNGYYPDGTIQSIKFYNSTGQDGWQKYFAVNGKIDYEEFYELGYVKKRLYYDSLGRVTNQAVFNTGSGELELKYANGKTRLKANIKDNLRQGDYIFYYPDGQVLSKRFFVNDEEEGEFKSFYPDGKTEWVRNYQAGESHGKHTRYFDNGEEARVTNYAYGEEVGKSVINYMNKKVERDFEYKNNVLNGISNVYAETGELAVQRMFKNGVLVSYSYVGKNGEMVAPIEVKNETGTVKTYYASGAPAMEYTLKNGELEGKRVLYFPNGKIQEEKTFIEGEQNGVRKYYYASGKIREEEAYKDDEQHGKYTSYYESGKIKEDGMFCMGKSHGVFHFYDAQGKLTRTLFYYDDEIIDEK